LGGGKGKVLRKCELLEIPHYGISGYGFTRYGFTGYGITGIILEYLKKEVRGMWLGRGVRNRDGGRHALQELEKFGLLGTSNPRSLIY
jgi:hypothetical protein